MFCKQLCIMAMVFCLFFPAFSSSEEADERDILLSASYRATSPEEIERIYKALPAEHDENYGFDRDRYFIWAVSNLIHDRMCCTGEERYDTSYFTLEEFEEKYAKGLPELATRLYALNPELSQIVRMLILAQAKCIFVARLKEARCAETFKKIEAQALEYRKRVDKTTSPALRQALALLVGTIFLHSNYADYNQRIGPSAIFLLAELDRMAFVAPKSTDKLARAFHNDCPINPIVETSVERTLAKVDADFHSCILFHEGAPLSPFFSTIARLRGYPQDKGVLEVPPFICSFFKNAPNFSTHHYASSHLLPYTTSCDSENSSIGFLSGHSKFICDIRTLHVKGEYNVCRKSRELLDARSPYFNKLMQLAAICDNPNACYDSEMWDKIPSKFLPDFNRYDEYLKQCDVYLAAYYPHTIKTSVLAKQGVLRRTTTFLSPDFSIEPLICPVFIPDELLRYTAHAGVHRTLFTYNAMGIGDITTSYPSK